MGNDIESLYVVMPAYNEAENIRAVVEDWYKVLDGKSEMSKLVVADSGSTDSTHDILIEMKRDYPKLEILSDTNKLHGPKVIALYDYAIKNGIDYVFQTDSDGQTNPDEFDTFWQMRKGYTGIFGNRTIREDGQDRAFVEKVVCVLLKIFFKVSVPDANAPFRLMRVESVKRYLYKMPNDYFLPNIMMTTFFVHYGERVYFKDISFKPRHGGENSIDIPKIIKIGIDALKDFAKFKREMRIAK